MALISKHSSVKADVNEIIRSVKVSSNKRQEEEYGIHLDEYKILGSGEDPFDFSPECNPYPLISHELKDWKTYCIIPTELRDLEVGCAGFELFRPGYTIVLYGPRRSGKSRLIRALCSHYRPYFPTAVVFTATKDSGEYFGFFPFDHVIDGLDEDLLWDLLATQSKKKKAETRGEDMGNYNLLIIFDDCMSEDLRYKKLFNKIFYNGRHYNITLIVSLQDVKGIAPAATANTDVAITFPLQDERAKETVKAKFADYLHRKEFEALMTSEYINKRYHCIFFDVAHRYNPLNRKITFGCLDDEEDKDTKFVMGDHEMWKDCQKQLYQLGFGYLLKMEDWGILKPGENQKEKKKK